MRDEERGPEGLTMCMGVRDPKHPFAQMGQSKQEGVKLLVLWKKNQC